MEPNKLNIHSTITLLSGNKIPIIGYGTYELHGQDCVEGTKTALKCGYTHIDTASYYNNEEQIRKAIEESGVAREKIYITSKIYPSQQGAK